MAGIRCAHVDTDNLAPHKVADVNIGYIGALTMRYFSLLLVLGLALAGCKPEDEPVEPRPVRTIAVVLKPIGEDRQVIGEVRPRYESELSFRVAGKMLSRPVDVGAWVK